MDPIFRHVAACNDATLPGARTPFHLAGQPVGYIGPALHTPLLAQGATLEPDGIHLQPGQLQPAARALADAGHFIWRNEAFDVSADAGGPALAQIDRGALPAFGISATGVHLNAMVRHGSQLLLWVATRSRTKLLDPGKLDHLVAGGVPAGLTPQETLLKEAEEEAGLPAHLLTTATPVGVIDYAMDRPEGLRRDRLHCFDVMLPESFTPEPRDGEVESFALHPLPDVLARVRDTDDFKFNVNLVLIDLFRRHGLL